jgi:4-amino-4-deoxy-L-arabinose transferase-like glycosyltransferase
MEGPGSPATSHASKRPWLPPLLVTMVVTLAYGLAPTRLALQGEETCRVLHGIEMAATGDWLFATNQGVRIIDRPPLQYWTFAVIHSWIHPLDPLAVIIAGATIVFLGMTAYSLFSVHEWVLRLAQPWWQIVLLLVLVVPAAGFLIRRASSSYPRDALWVTFIAGALVALLFNGPIINSLAQAAVDVRPDVASLYRRPGSKTRVGPSWMKTGPRRPQRQVEEQPTHPPCVKR